MGEVFALVNAIGWSAGMVFARRGQQRGETGILGGLYCSILVNTVINLAIFLVMLPAMKLPAVTAKGLLYLFLGGVFNSLIGRGMLFYIVSLLGASRAGVIKASTPMFALLCGIVLLHETIAPVKWIGIAAVLFGVLLIALEGSRKSSEGWGKSSLKGVLVGLLGSLFLAMGNMFRKLGVSAIPQSAFGAFIGSISAFLVLTVYFLLSDPNMVPRTLRRVDRDYALSGLSTSIALNFLFASLKLIPLSIANSLTAVEPLSTLVLSRIFLGKQEKLTVPLVLGAASTILGAVVLACL